VDSRRSYARVIVAPQGPTDYPDVILHLSTGCPQFCGQRGDLLDYGDMGAERYTGIGVTVRCSAEDDGGLARRLRGFAGRDRVEAIDAESGDGGGPEGIQPVATPQAHDGEGGAKDADEGVDCAEDEGARHAAWWGSGDRESEDERVRGDQKERTVRIGRVTGAAWRRARPQGVG